MSGQSAFNGRERAEAGEHRQSPEAHTRAGGAHRCPPGRPLLPLGAGTEAPARQRLLATLGLAAEPPPRPPVTGQSVPSGASLARPSRSSRRRPGSQAPAHRPSPGPPFPVPARTLSGGPRSDCARLGTVRRSGPGGACGGGSEAGSGRCCDPEGVEPAGLPAEEPAEYGGAHAPKAPEDARAYHPAPGAGAG